MADGRAATAGQFADPGQQREAAFLGMWLFLATEAMLFGGLFLAVIVYRYLYPEGVRAAARHLHLWIGGANTAVLLTSSLTMALAVLAARTGNRRAAARLLAATVLLGIGFLGLKGYEYWLEYGEGLMPGVGPPAPLASGPARLFINIYFIATALHGLHLLIGIGVVAVVALRIFLLRLRLPDRHVVVEIAGLFWHFVDAVWIFLYPVLYLIGR